MAATLVKVLVHIVFSTKKRVPFIDDPLRVDLYPYMAGIVRHKSSTLLALGGMPDHIHALVRLKADRSLSDLVRALKAVSSKWVHEKPNPIREFAWQTGYAAFSVSQSKEAAVKSYILNQESHHGRSAFEDELVGLLKKHKVDYDPAHLFD
jgi:REP element-mobilizing transposase RayT